MEDEKDYGYVYFARPRLGDNSLPVKIGWSKNPWANVNEGQRWTWFPLEVGAHIRIHLAHPLAGIGRMSLERLLHDTLKPMQLQREWFSFVGPVSEVFGLAFSGISAEELADWVSRRLARAELEAAQ